MDIEEKVKKILKELPSGVELVAATKTRSVEEIEQAIKAGVKIIGENYVQEAEEKFRVIGRKVKWHMIGHLQRRWQEKVLSFLAYIGISIPSFFIAMLLVFFFAKHPVLPIGGTRSIFAYKSTWQIFFDYLKHLLIPGMALTLAGIGSLYRLMKNNFLQEINSPYVITARAKGLPEYKVYYKHALRNAINPMITIFGYELSGILSGAALVEIITGWPGMGRLILESVLSQDLYLVMASLLIGGLLLITGNLIADILIAFTDPRVRLR